MAGLGCGSYRVNNNISSKKTYVSVKLTDSAQKSLQEYLKNQNSSNGHPTIAFYGNEGEIVIPSGNHDRAIFQFQMQKRHDSEEPPEGSFECIRQINSDSLESQGPLISIMRIKAKDDSYGMAVTSMANARAQNVKNSVKELEHKGVTNRPRQPRPSMIAPNHRRDVSNIASNPISSHNGNNSSSISPHNSSSGNSQGKPGWSQSLRHPPTNGKKPPTVNPALVRRPLRERIMQLLAIKPMKKLELISKISIEGTKECDKKKITSIICSVAVVKDNTYHLQRHLWAEVNEDWSFYTEEEKLMLKRNKPQNSSPPDKEMINSSQSPSSTVPLSPSPGMGFQEVPAKRPRVDQTFDQTAKKTRFGPPSAKLPDTSSRSENFCVSSSDQTWTGGASESGDSSVELDANVRRPMRPNQPYENSLHHPDNHIKRTESFAPDQFNSISQMNGHCVPSSVSPLSQSNSPREIVAAHKISVDSHGVRGKISSSTTSSSTTSSSAAVGRKRNGISHSHEDRKHRGQKVLSRGDENYDVNNHVESTSLQASPDSQLEAQQYPKIQDKQQRRQYKTDFNRMYKEYQVLHSELEETKQFFKGLEANLNKQQHGTLEYTEMKQDFLEEYDSRRPKWLEIRKRYNHLDKVLTHIKTAVNDYDAAIQF